MKKFLMSFVYAARGIRFAFRGQRNIKVQTAIGGIAIALSVALKIPVVELAVVIAVSFLVVILEMFNTGFEKLIDVISPEYHKEYGKIKDIIAGVVLMSAIMSVAVGVIILGPPMWKVLVGWLGR